jgi:hypothetical protein
MIIMRKKINGITFLGSLCQSSQQLLPKGVVSIYVCGHILLLASF